MTADERKIAGKIKGYLDAGTAELKSGTLYRLGQARAAALARLAEAQHAPDLALAGARGFARTSTGAPKPLYAQARVWVGIAVLALAVFGWQQWSAYQTVLEAEEIDAQLLSSDLPYDAYLDRGFQNWLRTVAQR